ncbi:MAG: hypothetical protein BGO86_05885 [Chryseobacterium sp. 36-9]|nr:MAG: hypothetical protein BGO86_05885 [Chryseobacterium sp. 36-9]
MKIGILTLPLWNNYGGIIQAYALQETLTNLGHAVSLIDYHHHQTDFDILKNNFLRFIKHRILKLENAPYYPNISENTYISVNTLDFIRNNFENKTRKVTDDASLKRETELLDAIIVGSDQVWRPNYTPDIANYFLKFAKDKQLKISYAASFGTDNWLYNDQEENICKELIKRFDAVSVRENSGVDLVKNKLDFVDAVQLIDPTMLLNVKDYQTLISKNSTYESKGTIFTYILDQNENIKKFIEKVEDVTDGKAFEVMPKTFDNNFNDKKGDYVFPSLLQWLRSFDDADYVIADSFHGCVFSIIFNKPFIAIGNKERGMARFISLLELFDLQDRLVDINNLDVEVIKKQIDWTSVNHKMAALQQDAITFLNKSLDVKRA